jgi:hypothetical protein
MTQDSETTIRGEVPSMNMTGRNLLILFLIGVMCWSCAALDDMLRDKLNPKSRELNTEIGTLTMDAAYERFGKPAKVLVSEESTMTYVLWFNTYGSMSKCGKTGSGLGKQEHCYQCHGSLYMLCMAFDRESQRMKKWKKESWNINPGRPYDGFYWRRGFLFNECDTDVRKDAKPIIDKFFKEFSDETPQYA